MEKQMKDLFDMLLDESLGLYGLDPQQLKSNQLGNSSNLIYEITSLGEDFILRIARKSKEFLDWYHSEMEWINYLSDNGVGVSRSVPSINNNLVEMILIEGQCFFISLFEKAKGHLPSVNDEEDWNDRLFTTWGETMGKMHRLAKTYEEDCGKLNRYEWNEKLYENELYPIEQLDDKMQGIWERLNRQINELPKDTESYGLVHYDLHHHNFFINNGAITVFDFDGCRYHWFACDIAIAIYHALQSIPRNEEEKRTSFAYAFLNAFFKGYLKEKSINEFWIKQIPLFLEYRRIFSYRFIKQLWSNVDLEEWQERYLVEMEEAIKETVSYVDVDWELIREGIEGIMDIMLTCRNISKIFRR